ncbi:Tn3 family transposase [Streptomyces sp. NPDC050546]|uniref:Tn3 family transposase n=1 Tax=Streptomyces sp. NPDC050546 TaxID=3365628 RepID=UPI00379C0D9B
MRVRRQHCEQRSEQMWCLMVASAAIVTWTTEHYGLAVTALRRAGRPVGDDLLAHIWPSRHANVNPFTAPRPHCSVLPAWSGGSGP